VNSFVPSGTAPPVRSGTRSPCFRGPESPESPCRSTVCGARNFTNLKSFGFFLTDRALSTSVDRHSQSSRPDRTRASPSGDASRRTTKSTQQNQYPTIRQVRQCDLVFGNPMTYASVRARTRSSSTPGSTVHRHTKQLRNPRRGGPADPGVPIGWAAGLSNAILALDVSARFSREGASA
jgi:hypothetical protein